MSLRKHGYYRRPIIDPSETDWQPIGDQHASSETDMPHRDHYTSSETHWRPTCLIEDRIA